MGALADSATALVHAAGPFWLVRLQREEKLLPAAVVREEVGDRIAQIQAAEGRKVFRKEKMTLTDEVTMDLMPRAFSQRKSIEALMDERNGWLWVNHASAPRAEDLLGALRDALGSLPAELPDTRHSPAQTMSQWLLQGNLPAGLQLGADADLADPQEGGGEVRARSMLLDCDEIRSHLESGKLVQRLALEWDERVSFVLDKDLTIRRLKFDEQLVSANDDIEEDELVRRDADFLLMSETISELQTLLVKSFGGLSE
ncbi:recombination-associated protein RdgC [Luminiphilus syltensis NOR5-1B]|uniref:Recombination-associated protein RdgC n=1 Tax=Luminiphilus syltensis NOR5-1B TaxID=565045 RepID=B8KUM5_9GAMM|nr:recombination-associated protein RdgC [Luminiphilus syltensis NOR5-1B]